jgi:hypothetical protein
VKKSGRFTRITSSHKIIGSIIKEKRLGIKRFFPGSTIGAAKDDFTPRSATVLPWERDLGGNEAGAE